MDAILRKQRSWPWIIGALAVIGALGGLILARLSLFDLALGLILLVTVVGSVIEPLVGVGLALMIAPVWAWSLAYMPRIPAMIGQYLFLLTAAIWAARMLARREVRLPHPPLLGPLLIFMFVMLLTLWTPADLWIAFWEWGKWGQILLMFLLVYAQLTRESSAARVGWTVALLGAAALLQAGMGVGQYLGLLPAPDPFMIDDVHARAFGMFVQPNPFGGFLGMLGSVIIGLSAWGLIAWGLQLWRMRRRAPDGTRAWPRCPAYVWMAGVVALVIVGAIGASWSRGAWMGFGAALLVMTAAMPRRGLWGVILVAALVIGGLALHRANVLPAPIADRMMSFLAYTNFRDVRGVSVTDANYAVIERMAHWQAALSMWRHNFWLGVGFGCYEPAYADYRLISWPLALGHAHNYYFNMLAETGIVGLTAYLGWLGALLVRLWQATRRLVDWRRGLALGLIGAWTHLAVHSLVDNLLVNNAHLHAGVLLALSAWVVAESRRISKR